MPRGRLTSRLAVGIPIGLTLSGMLAASPGSGDANDSRWTIEPGRRAGSVTSKTSETDLVRLFGQANVRREKLDGGEGSTRPGTVLFPGSDGELRIFWRSDGYQIPEYVVIGGTKTRWRTLEGITLSTSLEQLVRMNGRHFTLQGFAWDYSGTVVSWEGGRLAKYSDYLVIRLGPTEDLDKLSRDDFLSVLGEGGISSATPALGKLRVRIYQIIINLPNR